jgi:L-glutamine-phosphate cytidylyltransferase
VLAAGRGVRMGGRRPKALIPIGDHEPVLHYVLHGLQRAGIEDLMIVTGFRPAEVQDYVAEQWSDANVAFIRNARYASWGNFHSLRLAIDQSPGYRILAVNSDIVVPPDVFARVVGEPGDVVLAVQQRETLDPEDMRVQLAGDRVVAIGKGLPMDRSHGEFSGISLLSPRAAATYADLASAVEWRAETSIYYEDLFALMLDSLYARWAPVEADEYAEVDEPSDLAEAAKVIERHAGAWEEAPPASSEAG